MNNMYKACLCVALIASLACVSFATPTFESDYETSTVSGLKSFKKVYTENKNKDFDCDDVPQLRITIAYDDDYSVTMYPKACRSYIILLFLLYTYTAHRTSLI